MMKALLVIASILLVANFSEAGMGYNGGSSNGGYNGNMQGQGQRYSQNEQYYVPSKNYPEEPSSAVQKPPPTSSSGLGISAWGIIALIVVLALLVTLGYFACELYPYMTTQKPTRNSMEMTCVV